MAPYLYARRVHYDEFVQRVRRHAPSSLLPIVAKAGAAYAEPGSWMKSPYKKLTPWTLAEIARVSINSGNEQRPPASNDDLMQCCAAYTGLSDPDLGNGTIEDFANFMLRMAFQQMTYQLLARNELGRSIALFEQTQPANSLQVIQGNWAKELLGCSVSEYVGVAFLFHVGAVVNEGTFDLDWINQPNFAEIRDEVSADIILQVANKHFIATRDEFRALQPRPNARQHPDTLRFQFNPLEARPVLSGFNNRLLIPVPPLLIRKVSSLGLYYTGCQRWGDAFTQDLGIIFESYIGNQLRLLDNAVVLPAIRYGRDNRESVDWIVLFENVILLVEVKSTRPTEAIRVANDSAVEDLKRTLAKAVRQINVTAEHVRGRHAAFSEVPHDRPIIGLVVTMEDFHIVNAPMYRQLLPDSVEPVRICSAFELEQMVTVLDRSVGDLLLDFVNDANRQDWSIGSMFTQDSGQNLGRNVIIDRAFRALPWKEHDKEA